MPPIHCAPWTRSLPRWRVGDRFLATCRGRALQVNGAVATGRVVFGAVGDAHRLEFTVIGSAVNLAAKLEKHNKAVGAVALTTRMAFELAQRQGYEPTGSADTLADACVEGLAEPTDLVVLARPA